MARRLDSLQESEYETVMSFFNDVSDRFASDPAVYHELLRILRALARGETTDRGEVVAKGNALLQGHPDLVRRFGAFCPAPEPARDDPTPTRPKRERRPTAVNDPDIGKALRYFQRVKEAGLYDKLHALILHANSDKDVNKIYKRALKIFGSPHSDLLREFTEFLPIPTPRERDVLLRRRTKEPSPEEHRAPSPKRKAAAADNAIVAKKPCADERKTANRRAYSPAIVDAAPVSAFREAWEFETTYTKLVATARRITELLNEYEPLEDGEPKDVPPPRGRRIFEQLFPSRECQEVLQEMYGDMLTLIRDALEDGARTELALRTIKRRLGMLEQLAVKMAMERRDRDRVEGRMQKLAVDRVRVLLKNQKKQSAGT